MGWIMRIKLLLGCATIAFASLGTTAASAEGAGYIQGFAGVEWGWSTNYNPGPIVTYTWQDLQSGGAARAAARLGQNWSIQGDAWTTLAFVASTVDGLDWGTASHVTWHSANDTFMLGVFGSLGGGGFNSGVLGNVGVEAVINAEQWRIYAQVGLVNALTGDVATNEERDLYATVSVNYFISPNVFVSANIGADNWTTVNGDASRELSWGGKLELRPDNSPVSFFIAYEGFGFYSTYGLTTDFDRGLDHILFAGFRVPIGAQSLQDLQTTVGLADLNPMYGDLINR